MSNKLVKWGNHYIIPGLVTYIGQATEEDAGDEDKFSFKMIYDKEWVKHEEETEEDIINSRNELIKLCEAEK